MLDIIIPACGILGFLFFVFSIQLKKKKDILFLQLVSNAFYTISYSLLGAFSAVFIDIISAIRCLIFAYFDGKKKTPVIYLVILILLSCSVGIFVVKETFDVLPIIISIIYIITTWQDKKIIIELGFIIAAILWLIYNIYVKNYTPMIGNIFEIISGIVAIIRFQKKKEDING